MDSHDPLISHVDGMTSMAEFIIEWCEINQKQIPHDFSIRKIFLKFQEGVLHETFCEGFGIIKI